MADPNLDLETLRQHLAAIEHQRWADWQRWMHEQCARRPNGALIIPAELVERWERQIATPFEQLSEAEQRSDMEQVDRYWPLIGPALERIPELKRLVAEYRQDHLERVDEARSWRERAERVEAALRNVVADCEAIGNDLDSDVTVSRGMINEAAAALAAAPAEEGER